MRIAESCCQHLLGDAPRDIPDSFVAGTALGMIGDEGMPDILPPT
jgi:hypothetical protein